jgi:hypothetical protein
VVDTLADVTKTYVSELGTGFAPVLDTVGFDTCEL